MDTISVDTKNMIAKAKAKVNEETKDMTIEQMLEYTKKCRLEFDIAMAELRATGWTKPRRKLSRI